MKCEKCGNMIRAKTGSDVDTITLICTNGHMQISDEEKIKVNKYQQQKIDIGKQTTKNRFGN